jgi:hypothetical protein
MDPQPASVAELTSWGWTLSVCLGVLLALIAEVYVRGLEEEIRWLRRRLEQLREEIEWLKRGGTP